MTKIIPHRPIGVRVLTDKEVLDLRLRKQNGEEIDVMYEADRFACSLSTIKKMLKGETYRWVGAVPREREAPALLGPMSEKARQSLERLTAKGLLQNGDPTVADKLTEEIKASPLHDAKTYEAAKALGVNFFEPPPADEPVGNPLDD